ncbi:peptidoglycan recognition protein family protein [Lactococcus lactis]|uniref:peptidoglycan recognition protein family protein n=1 Tax=Lactococcus lactis TaxID=1358 RepID=UPI00288D0117|nr:N-acetylmuramoyl-L-alanine amidase [Lactococcus lactis]MDT2857285.1 N-acetylmuramoyl-L-alanine amidase [Lactococcus lactis]
MAIYDKTFLLGPGQGSSQKASNQYIVIHDTANDDNQGDNSAENEASFMHNNWQNAYTHAIAGWDKVYLVGEPGYVAYGAGSPANERSPFQIELSHYSDPTKQRSSYINYINAVREQAKVFGIPLTLDGAGNGIKTHKWVSDNLWGDHQDPYAYLTRIGISKYQLAKDLANGISGASNSEGWTKLSGSDNANQNNKNQTEAKGEITMFLIRGLDANRKPQHWFISNGLDVNHVNTTRMLAEYQNKGARMNLPTSTMYMTEIEDEFHVKIDEKTGAVTKK